MEYLLGALAALVGWLLIEKSKRKSAEGLLENLETTKKTLEVDKNINKNTALIEAEENKRQDIQKDEPKKSLQEIADALNKRKPKR